CENPEESFCRAIELLSKDEMIEEMESCCIHPTAQIDSTAFLGKGVRIGPGVVVGPHVRIGSHTILLPGVVIGHEVEIGENCQLHPNCVIYRRCRMGSRVVIGANAVIGGIGFGLQKTDQGFKRHKHYGAVEIADDVEIGANTTIDRARWGMTRIGRGTKIDNQVQIAHNVQIGNHNAIAAQTGIAGSSRTGSWVICGGKSAVNDHIEITSGVVLAACSAVSKSLKEPGVYSGLPVSPVHEHNRRHALLKNIHKLVERIKKLEEIQCSEVNK
ncbi:MAG: UDP-3-O-(3-hydroxymyristoyl)glucosamine N-acyltransferase, partial [Chlamydiia bacterium]|nr:UDP-3-O-(3-hydroxymyristoyl)glucosamine N-acyltransferase [Chlamydiia bacterium]